MRRHRGIETILSDRFGATTSTTTNKDRNSQYNTDEQSASMRRTECECPRRKQADGQCNEERASCAGYLISYPLQRLEAAEDYA